ncbi:hypothetical protein WN51_05236 [Melipona quadrifasciata]|uniref:Uncharacterized protein n=1 Tax=Melipona quadrifasciata TaxID=166423 RepID=A0A0M8ZUJ2_9HYME|nr:hypothetical protein WN51_05236 [Melipona quadrifasciata]
MANINWPVYREKERERGKEPKEKRRKKPPQRRSLSNFFPSLDSLPAALTLDSAITINSRTCLR